MQSEACASVPLPVHAREHWIRQLRACTCSHAPAVPHTCLASRTLRSWPTLSWISATCTAAAAPLLPEPHYHRQSCFHGQCPPCLAGYPASWPCLGSGTEAHLRACSSLPSSCEVWQSKSPDPDCMAAAASPGGSLCQAFCRGSGGHALSWFSTLPGTCDSASWH